MKLFFSLLNSLITWLITPIASAKPALNMLEDTNKCIIIIITELFNRNLSLNFNKINSQLFQVPLDTFDHNDNKFNKLPLYD